MIHKACMPVYIVIQIFSAGGHSTRGSTRGPRGPKNGDYYDGDDEKNGWHWLMMMMEVGIMRSTSSSRSAVA